MGKNQYQWQGRSSAPLLFAVTGPQGKGAGNVLIKKPYSGLGLL